MSVQSHLILRFGAFEIDGRAGELRKNGVRLKLQEQPFQVLCVLVERPGEVVTREELRNRLWPADTFVDFDHSVNAAIKRLRDALGDSAESPRFVETLPRRGYRFIASMDKLDGDGTPIGTIHERGNVPARAVDIRLSSPEVRVGRRISPIPAILGIAVLIVVLAIWLKSPLPEALPELTQRQLTANSPENTVWSGAISPNGKYLAYVDATGIRLKQLKTGELGTVPEPEGLQSGPVRWHIASWFPDSSAFIVVAMQPPLHSSNLGGIAHRAATSAAPG